MYMTGMKADEKEGRKEGRKKGQNTQIKNEGNSCSSQGG